MPLTLRIRSSQGMWRLTVADATVTVATVKTQIEREKQVAVATQKLTKDPQGTQELDDGSRLDAAGLGANGSIIYLSEKIVSHRERRRRRRPPPPPNPLAAAGRNVLAGNDNGMSAEDQAAIAAALAEDDAPASPEVRRPDATQSPEALVGPPSSVGGLLEGLMNAPGGAAALAHAFQARQNAQRAARDDIYDSDDEDRDVARRLQDDYDEEEEDDDEALARRLQDGDEEGDARLARRLAGSAAVRSARRRGPRGLFGRRRAASIRTAPVDGRGRPGLATRALQSTRPQHGAFAAGVDAQLERALAASRAGRPRGDGALGRARAGVAGRRRRRRRRCRRRCSARRPGGEEAPDRRGHPAVGAGSRARGGPDDGRRGDGGPAAEPAPRQQRPRRAYDERLGFAQDGLTVCNTLHKHLVALLAGAHALRGDRLPGQEGNLGRPVLLLLGEPVRRRVEGRHRGRVSFVYNRAVSYTAEPRALHLAGLAVVPARLPVVHAPLVGVRALAGRDIF